MIDGVTATVATRSERTTRSTEVTPRRGTASIRRGGASLHAGAAVGWLSVMVLLPLAAIAWQSGEEGPQAFWSAICSPEALAALRVTLVTAAAVAALNGVLGLMVAWVLVRDDFPGRRLMNALIDVPFALPTIVASLVMQALYGPRSPFGLHLQHTRWGLGVALLFVTLPFVVRSVQPVLLELDPATDEAARSLGASSTDLFTHVALPAVLPAALSGMGLAFARAIGEYGSVVLIGGAIPGKTELASQWIHTLVEVHDRAGAAAISIVLLSISLSVLFGLRLVGSTATRREAAAA